MDPIRADADSDPTPIEKLFENAEAYARTSLKLNRLKAIDKTAGVSSSLAVCIALLLAIGLFTLVVNIGIALWIGEVQGKLYHGFFIVGAFYLLAAILLYVFRDKWIKDPLNNFIIGQLLKEKDKTA
jgi:hypothetical protein